MAGVFAQTGIVAEQLLIRILKRAKSLLEKGVSIECSAVLLFFMQNKITKDNFDSTVLKKFAQLDDVDILSALKQWQEHDDFVLSKMCQMLINRRLLNIKLKNRPITDLKLSKHFDSFKEEHGLSDEETAYFVFLGEIENQAYDTENQNINILKKNGRLLDVAKASDHLNIKALSKKVTKYYICYPKDSL